MTEPIADTGLQTSLARALGDANIPLVRIPYGLCRGVVFPDVARFVEHVSAIRKRQLEAGEAPRLYICPERTRRLPGDGGFEIWFCTWVRSFEKQCSPLVRRDSLGRRIGSH